MSESSEQNGVPEDSAVAIARKGALGRAFEALQRKEVWKGIGVLFLCHVAVVLLSFFRDQMLGHGAMSLWTLSAFFGVGIVQLLYGIPLILLFRARKKPECCKAL